MIDLFDKGFSYKMPLTLKVDTKDSFFMNVTYNRVTRSISTSPSFQQAQKAYSMMENIRSSTQEILRTALYYVLQINVKSN